jgi:hypothetical protein
MFTVTVVAGRRVDVVGLSRMTAVGEKTMVLATDAVCGLLAAKALVPKHTAASSSKRLSNRRNGKQKESADECPYRERLLVALSIVA